MEKRLKTLSRSLSLSESKALGVARAAWQLEDALFGQVAEEYPHDLEAREEHLKMVASEARCHRALLALLVLTFFEAPAWCTGASSDESLWSSLWDLNTCNVDADTYATSGIWYLPAGVGLLIELLLLFIIFRHLRCARKLQEQYFGTRHDYDIDVGFAMVAIEVIDCVVFALVRPRFRLAFVARTGFICMLPAVSQLAVCISACLKEMLSVAVFLAGLMLFYAWIAVLSLKDLKEGTEGFDTFSHSLNSVFVAAVSDEFVAVFLSSYTTYRWIGLLWLSFLLLAHVLLLSLVLDTLVAAYMTYSEETMKELVEKKVKGMLQAFHHLSRVTGGGEGWVDRDGFCLFIREYSRSSRAADIPEEMADGLYMATDSDGNGVIDQKEFCSICCHIAQYRLECTTTYSQLKYRYPELWERFGWFREMVEGAEDEVASRFDIFMNQVLIANFVLMIAESIYDNYKMEEPEWCDIGELCFSLIYLVQIGVKLSVFSFQEYWCDYSNRFDFFTTWLLLVSGLLEDFLGSELSRYANMLRLLRLLRMIRNLQNLKSVQFIVDVISKLLLASKDMMTLLGAVIFFFTTISVQLFGGVLSGDNPRLEGTEYLEKGMLVFNCNDVPMAFGTWTVILLLEYEPSIPDAVDAASPIPGSWILFPLFYVCAVSIAFELVKAFTIEVFISLQKEVSQNTQKVHGKCVRLGQSKFINDLSELFRQHEKTLHWHVVGSHTLYNEMMEAVEELCGEEGKSREGSFSAPSDQSAKAEK